MPAAPPAAAPRDAYDLAVIGGGINGVAIARDAAGRGLAVLLVEQGDLAGATSSASTKLIHGGLRYLEHGAFRLVREALAEREVLLRAAPHIVRPLAFVLPHRPGLRPRWLIRLGLLLYDRLGGRRILPPTRRLDLRRAPEGAPLRPGFTAGFAYADCWVDDARLVVLTARDAADRGAAIRVRTRCVAAERAGGVWRLALAGEGAGEARARVLVNAAGPWAGQVLAKVTRGTAPARLRLVRGSHIVVPRLWDGPHAYVLQNADGRVCFAIPFEEDFTLIGTTDVDVDDPAATAVEAAERRYLCAAVSAYLVRPVTEAEIVWSYGGIRALHDDGASRAQEVRRDYVLALDAPAGAPPLLSVFGGKLTTHRPLAEAALARLAPYLPSMRGPWTAAAPLPGGDFPHDGVPELVRRLRAQHPWLAAATARRLVHQFGTDAFRLLQGATGPEAPILADLTLRELRWLMEREWARTPEDVLWRRTKVGLRATAAAVQALARVMGTPAQAAASHPAPMS